MCGTNDDLSQELLPVSAYPVTSGLFAPMALDYTNRAAPPSDQSVGPPARTPSESIMAKGQQKSSKEVRKPKKAVPAKPTALAAATKSAMPHLMKD